LGLEAMLESNAVRCADADDQIDSSARAGFHLQRGCLPRCGKQVQSDANAEQQTCNRVTFSGMVHEVSLLVLPSRTSIARSHYHPSAKPEFIARSRGKSTGRPAEPQRSPG